MLPSLISLSQSLHDGNPYEVEPPNPPLGPRFPKIKSEVEPPNPPLGPRFPELKGTMAPPLYPVDPPKTFPPKVWSL